MCKSHLQSGEKQIGYDFGISNMSKTSFFKGVKKNIRLCLVRHA
jgi:hypothetical protein